MLRWVEALGDRADALAALDPPLSPQRAIEELTAVARPEGLVAPAPDRLLRLAVSASRTAVLSPRQELYPRGFSADRALALGAGSLLNVKAHGRASQAASRESSASPTRAPPQSGHAAYGCRGAAALDPPRSRIRAAAACRSRRPRLAQEGTMPRQGQGRQRRCTARHADTEAARELDRRLRAVAADGRFLALTVEPRFLLDAESRILAGYGLRRLNLERLLIDAMREQARVLGVDWRVVEMADASDRGAREWRNLRQLAQRSQPAMEAALQGIAEPTLLVNAGLLARYGLLGAIQMLQDRARRGPGVALLIAADDQHALPVVDDVTLPMVYPTDWMRLSRSWVRAQSPAA